MAKFVDDIGATRHAMSYDELNELYKQLVISLLIARLRKQKKTGTHLLRLKQ